VSEITLANVILIVSTGVMTDGAKNYRERIINKTPLNIVVLDGRALEEIVKDPAAITSILKTQAQDAMQHKPQPSALSHNDFRVNRFQFDSGVADLELPVNPALLGVVVLMPSFGF